MASPNWCEFKRPDGSSLTLDLNSVDVVRAATDNDTDCKEPCTYFWLKTGKMQVVMGAYEDVRKHFRKTED